MSRCDWLLNPPVVFGIAIVVVLLGSVSLIDQKREADRTYATAKQEYENSKGIAPAVKPAQSAQTDPKSYRDEWRSEQDLEAQWQMAKWSLWMFITTTAGVVVTGAGVYYVAQTLSLNRTLLREAAKTTNAAFMSAQAAIDAVRETKRAADASAAAVVVAKVALVAQQRPWLMIDFDLHEVTFTPSSVVVRCTIGVKNVGNSPALATPAAMHFSREFVSQAVTDARERAQRDLDVITNLIPQNDRSAFSVEAKDDDHAGRSIDFAIAVFYRMVGHKEVFETLHVVRAFLPNSGFPARRMGKYDGPIQLTRMHDSRMT